MLYDGFVGVLLGVVIPLLLLLELLPEVLALDEPLLYIALLVIIIQVEELLETFSCCIVLIAVLIIVLPRSAVFITGALAIMTEHIHLLGIEAILNKEF